MTRVIRNAPPALLRQVRASDLAANQLRRQSIEPSRLERACWIALAPLAVVSFYLVASL